jgi:predicted nuclease of predicted toxin-antitoxin system
MRLLFDHNLSPRLVDRLGNLYPNASHVSLVGLDRASDDAVWQYAQAHDYIILSKDADFTDLSVLRGFPPKVICLRIGNCTTGQIEAFLRAHHVTITLFAADPSVGTLSLD